MNGAQVEFSPEALREIDDAFEWYLKRSVQAAEALVREVTKALALIAASPAIWPRFEAGTRRYVLRKFPYGIIERFQTASKSSPWRTKKGAPYIGADAWPRDAATEHSPLASKLLNLSEIGHRRAVRRDRVGRPVSERHRLGALSREAGRIGERVLTLESR